MSTATKRSLKDRIGLAATLSAFLLCFAIVANIGPSGSRKDAPDQPGQEARYAAARP